MTGVQTCALPISGFLAERLLAQADKEADHSRVCASQLDPTQDTDEDKRLSFEEAHLANVSAHLGRVSTLEDVYARASAKTPTQELAAEHARLRKQKADVERELAAANQNVDGLRAAKPVSFAAAVQSLAQFDPSLPAAFVQVQTDQSADVVSALVSRVEHVYRVASRVFHTDKNTGDTDEERDANVRALARLTAAKHALLARLAALTDDLADSHRAHKRPRFDPDLDRSDPA